ncbi:trypsin-like serine peptidase [Kitasatospora purpeofusca]|uniref:trypsin-like serine peptidase n=1 Tax=Kitasatospora purpeofusca TaxID=67352 RepID=UPI00224FB28D|nr:serine protease [Kitasatospora purpeofusca]MCX4754878.1 serine protease [Kitasatospora purpeofusca]WSR34263.1 serine protease [Kitasatospora purpeofusca]
MGQHRRRTPRRRRLLAPTLVTTALSVLTVAVVVVGTHSLTPRATAVASPATSAAVAPPVPGTPTVPAAVPVTGTEPSVASEPSELSAPSAPSASEPAAPGPAPTTATPAPTAAAPTPAGGPLGTTATAPATPEAATVGALFTGAVRPGNHFCTASVLHSTTGNLLITAAHCLDDPSGVVFAPGYRDGKAPYGTWRVTAVHTTTGWSRGGDPDEDFAVLETAADATGRRVEDVVGGNTLGTDEPFGATVRLYGYPAGGESPLLCSNTTGRQSTYQRVIDCPGYPGGTSGGPWISTATGHVVGAIGGYQQGGDTDGTSYSAYFDHTVAALYAEAAAAAS